MKVENTYAKTHGVRGSINFKRNTQLVDLILPCYEFHLQQNNFLFSLEIERTKFLFSNGCLSHLNLKAPLFRHLLPLNLQSFLGTHLSDVICLGFILTAFKGHQEVVTEQSRILILKGCFSCRDSLG